MNLSTQELAQLRADQADYWPDTCTFQAATRTADGMGGGSLAWSDTHSGVSCRLSPLVLSRGEGTQADQIQAATRWILSVAHSQEMSEQWRVSHGGKTYEIERLEDTHSNRTARRAYLVRLD